MIVVEPPGGRLDVYLADRTSDSRTSIQSMIRNGQITVNGAVVLKPAFDLQSGDEVQVTHVETEPVLSEVEPQALNIVSDTVDFLVINKPAGLVVHPSPGHEHGTLAQAVLNYVPELKGVGEVGREGLVHRLDKDTSGLVVFAKTEASLSHLQHQFKSRKVSKTYLALVDGHPASEKGRVEAPIARDPKNRQRFAVQQGGRSAVTEFRIRERYVRHSLLEAYPITGRTHQIRIHLQFLETPVVGDLVYGRKKMSLDVERQQLHAWKLKLPEHDEFEAPIPGDMQHAIRQAGDER